MALTKRQAHGDLPDPLRERPGIVSTVHSRPASLDTRARHALLDKHRGPRAHTLSCRMSRTFPRKQESPSTPHSLDRTSLACSSRLPLLGSGGPDALPPRPVFLIRPSLCVCLRKHGQHAANLSSSVLGSLILVLPNASTKPAQYLFVGFDNRLPCLLAL